MTVDPAQLRTSVANRFGSGSSWVGVSSKFHGLFYAEPYNLPAIDANNKVIPRFYWYFMVLVAEDLKTKGALEAPFGLLWRDISIET